MTSFDRENLMEITPDIGDGNSATSSIIKVIGVGGGGSNAARHMYNMGIADVDFMICNTDKQALDSNPIPIRIQLGESGLGAGAIPDVARKAALDSEEKIKAVLTGTKMLFITAGMGGGTGTGASPIVANIARELDILTIGIVTYPFKFEQKDKFELADEGIRELSQNVDALIIIKNEALKSFYPDLKLSNAFAKVDDVLLIAAKSIAELITLESIINVDFNDVKTVLKNSGTVLIGSGEAEGEDRALKSVESAINSPLLDQNSIYGAENLLFFISYSDENEATINELDKITEELGNKTCSACKKLIWGHGFDNTLGDKIRITVIATGLHNNAGTFDKKTFAKKEPIEDKQLKIQYEKSDSTAPETKPKTNESNTIELTLENIPDNNELRKKSEDEMSEYLNIPAYYREKELKGYDKSAKEREEISNYKASSKGIECATPSFLKSVVD
ncbi:MAG: cell division protein FtsZ [Bacteroidales bacterium]|jgi:cell division protein FtsZ|nr:cell division protein FtsZ [Bacteroidales bacterium]